ncbi:MAG: NUDIX domain-containing protein [Acidiferrobacterales bacterium]
MSKRTSADERVEILEKSSPFRGYFRIDRYRLRHRKHDGGWTPPLTREVLERGQTVAILPYDPIADTVVLIEQFRIGAYAAELEPWLTEVVAGTVEPGEDPEAVARREVVEEAGCQVTEVERIGKILLSSGASSETTTMYCGRVDSGGVGGIHGLEHEGEDILVSVLSADVAIAQVASGQIANAYAIIPLQWLALNRERLREAWN